MAGGVEIEAVYVEAGSLDHVLAALDLPPGVSVRELAPGVLERVASTVTPQPVLAIARQCDVPLAAVTGWAVVAAGVGDPGNLGTILRVAEAAGAARVVTLEGTVDVFSPKVVRASAGALFHVPAVVASLEDVAAAGLRLVGTSSHRGDRHTEADWSGRVAIVAGSEAHGVADDAPVDQWVRIEHRGRAESLNVAMATTVLCFEAARARATS